jgi:hypothetical protein
MHVGARRAVGGRRRCDGCAHVGAVGQRAIARLIEYSMTRRQGKEERLTVRRHAYPHIRGV